jgi:diguanylate cyclase (GGDEF)-like protein
MQRYLGSFIETVHALGKTVVAEGVNDHGDLAAAIRLGVDGLQGYLIARPMEWDAVASFLTDSPWSAEAIEAMVSKSRSSDRLLKTALPVPDGAGGVPLERYILDKWFELRSFEEFLLLFVNELKSWGLEILRLSLAFLPDEDDIDCSQYVWNHSKPGEVTTLRMDRSFLEREEHQASPLHHIATRVPLFRQRLGSQREMLFPFLEKLKEENCNDYLGLRLDSRGISIPVLTIALRGESSFSDEQIQRICSMSSLLSLLFYTFESERAKRLALLDPLTNVPNRRSFDSFLKSLVTAARLNNDRFALVLVDIDRFKLVNDTLGHAYGDACLKQVATILNSDLRRSSDVVARLGGEEFALILPNTDGPEALWICERLREAVLLAKVPGPDGGEGMPLSVSLGVALWDPQAFPGCDGDQLQQLADDCLYEAKRQGRNRVVGRQAVG